MTRLVVFPNERTQVNLIVPESQAALLDAINRETWTPPPELKTSLAPGVRLRALRLGQQSVLAVALLSSDEPQTQPRSGDLLTIRQVAVLQYLAQGLNARQIASRMGLAERTAYMHCAEIRRRLRAWTNPEAVARATELGLFRPRQSGR